FPFDLLTLRSVCESASRRLQDNLFGSLGLSFMYSICNPRTFSFPRCIRPITPKNCPTHPSSVYGTLHCDLIIDRSSLFKDSKSASRCHVVSWSTVSCISNQICSSSRASKSVGKYMILASTTKCLPNNGCLGASVGSV